MKFYVKESDYEKVALITEKGHVLAYFSSINDALTACEEWYFASKREQHYEIMINHNISIIENQTLDAA